jgi:hypothetical protein
MPRYKLRTLLILLAVGPLIVSWTVPPLVRWLAPSTPESTYAPPAPPAPPAFRFQIGTSQEVQLESNDVTHVLLPLPLRRQSEPPRTQT